MRNLLPVLFVFIHCLAHGQDKPVSWTVGVEKAGEKGFVLMLKATVRDGWNLYADNPKADIAGPQLIIQSGNAGPEGPLQPTNPSVVITDSIFGPLVRVFRNEAVFSQRMRASDNPSPMTFTIEAFASDGKTFLPISQEITVLPPGATASLGTAPVSGIKDDSPLADCGDKSVVGKSLLGIVLIGFGGGLLALLTPCIFPMIPVTVSFFTGRSKTKVQAVKNALLYGASIFVLYILASLPFHLIGNINPQIFNIIATNAWVNLLFFVIFILFALSFFGLFEIKLPSAIANASGSKSGIFFMALTLVIVSFSCTGIILGSLLVNALAANGNAWQLTAGMGGFGLALALPFGLFALFPQWLKKLPKSGGWLETVKKSLAFVELALAIKFLSNADLVEHWGLLKREVFIGLWLLIAVGLGLYLWGAFDRTQKSHSVLHSSDTPARSRYRISAGRWLAGAVVFGFAAYLVPGLTNTEHAQLKLLSGFPPPASYSIYDSPNPHQKNLEPDVINDYAKAIALSRQTGKPLLIDFTGWACVNCRKMEELVWTKPAVSELIRDHYILLSLYVDDRKKLPEGGTVGQKWASFQEQNFKQVTQPLYVLLSPDEQLLNHPVGYTPEAADYTNWLQCGLDAFHQNAKTMVKR